MAIGYWLLAVGHWSLVLGHWLMAASFVFCVICEICENLIVRGKRTPFLTFGGQQKNGFTRIFRNQLQYSNITI
jgi:hypothetical protein